MSDDDLQQQFDAEVNKVIDQIDTTERQAVQRALDLLNELRAEIRLRLADAGQSFTSSVYKQVERSIENDINSFEQQLQGQLTSDLNKMATLGEALIDNPSIIITGPSLSVSGANVAQIAASYVPGLIKGLGNSANQAIATILRKAVLGVSSIEEAIQEVGKNLKDPGPFKGLGARAETIVRTEGLRVQSMAADQRMKANEPLIKRFGWSMMQAWLTADDFRVRPAHAAVNGWEVEVGKPFLVGGEELRYPRDPKGSAGNTINCRCVARPVVKRMTAQQSWHLPLAA